MAADLAFDGDDALRKASLWLYDVIILDRDLPVVHGDEVCRTLVRNGSSARVLMLTASGRIAERVSGLDIGADDYLTKPFALAELIARVRALHRRSHTALPPVVRYADIEVDIANHRARRRGEVLTLSPKELAVLQHLVRAGGRPVPAEELLEKVWDEFVDPLTSVVKVTISRLRDRLGAPPIIETVPRAGYRLRPDGAS